MGIAGKIATFMFFANIAAFMFGFLISGIIPGAASPWLGDTNSQQVQQLRANVTSYPTDNSGSSVFVRIFDYITLGFLGRIVSFLDSLFFGFIVMLENIGLIPQTLPWIGIALRSMLGFMYAVWGIELYTGRDLGGS